MPHLSFGSPRPEPVLRSWLPVLGLLLYTAPLAAQDSLPPADTTSLAAPVDSTDQLAAPLPVQTDSLGRPIVQYVEVRGSDIFDSSETHNWTQRLMNGLHFRTHLGIIEREVLIHPGEPYDSARSAETARNLRSLGLFRRVRLDTVRTDSGLVFRVYAQDGWSTQADLRFRSAGKQTDWQVSLIERNLIGTATLFATRYRHTPDRSLVNFQLLKRRLIARTVALGLRYESRSDGKRGSVSIDRPFLALSDRRGISIGFDTRNERIIQFRDGSSDPSDSTRRRYTIGVIEAATALRASNTGYLRLGLTGQVRREDYAPWPSKPGTQTVTGTAGTFIEWRRANYVVTQGFARIGRDEDVDVSNFARLGVIAAPKFLGYDSGGVGLVAQLRVGTQLPSGFAWVDARANGLYGSGGLDSGSVAFGGTAVLAPIPRHKLIAHAEIGWIKNPLPAAEFDLGFATGPRGFPIHAFTGDRNYFTTAEYRFIFGQDLFKALDLGAAAFVDHGGAWFHTEARRTGTDVGLGLRLSPSRAADANPTRLDLAYRFKNDAQKAGWVFVIASGLVFSTQPRGGS